MLNPSDILYVDNHLLAVNKPAGLVTQPSGLHADSLESRAKEWVRVTYARPGNVFLEAVHRLDRPVSGVVLFARTSKALSRLQAQVRGRDVGKLYWAVLEGVPEARAGRLEDWLVHGSHQAQVVPAGTPGAQMAQLEYRVLEQTGALAWVEVQLLTGRYHQIRAQFAHRGHPVVGDRRYGARDGLPGGTIALHHRQFRVEHPVQRQALIITAPCAMTGPWARLKPLAEPTPS